MQFCHTVLSLCAENTGYKIETILRQSDRPLMMISKMYQGLIEAFPDDTKHVNQKCEEDLGDTN